MERYIGLLQESLHGHLELGEEQLHGAVRGMIHTFHRLWARKLLDPLPLLSVCWVKFKLEIKEKFGILLTTFPVSRTPTISSWWLKHKAIYETWTFCYLSGVHGGSFWFQLSSTIKAPVPLNSRSKRLVWISLCDRISQVLVQFPDCPCFPASVNPESLCFTTGASTG